MVVVGLVQQREAVVGEEEVEIPVNHESVFSTIRRDNIEEGVAEEEAMIHVIVISFKLKLKN